MQVARQSVETFRQNALEYPSSYEKIADVNNKAPARRACGGDSYGLQRCPVYVSSNFTLAACQEKDADIICTIGPKSCNPEVGSGIKASKCHR